MYFSIQETMHYHITENNKESLHFYGIGDVSARRRVDYIPEIGGCNIWKKVANNKNLIPALCR